MDAVVHGVIDAKYSAVFYGFSEPERRGKTCHRDTGRTKQRTGASKTGCVRA